MTSTVIKGWAKGGWEGWLLLFENVPPRGTREKDAVVTSSARSSPRQMMKWSSINRLLNTAADPKVGGFIWFNGLDFWGVRLKELGLGLVI